MTDDAKRIEYEAAAYRRLVEHLRERTDVQNLDLMELAGFCRNCLARWYAEAAAEGGEEISKDDARELVYGCRTRSGRRSTSTRRFLDGYITRG
jgi:hypothetical protein